MTEQIQHSYTASSNTEYDNVTFRNCRVDDVEQAIVLIRSSGPQEYDYVFCQSHSNQTIDFLRTTFVRSGSEFSFEQHTAVIIDNKIVGIGGIRTKPQNCTHTIEGVKSIISYYGLMRGVKVIYRGLKTENVLRLPQTDEAIIYHVAINPEYRKHGLGKKLINFLLEKIDQDHKPCVPCLDVARSNAAAKRLYENIGFKAVDWRIRELRSEFGHVEPHLRMRKPPE